MVEKRCRFRSSGGICYARDYNNATTDSRGICIVIKKCTEFEEGDFKKWSDMHRNKRKIQ